MAARPAQPRPAGDGKEDAVKGREAPGPAALHDCRVVESRPVGAYRLISFVCREIAAAARPGQFVMVRESGPALDPLLPRPMGIHDIGSDLISILIEPVGKGSGRLAASKVGDRLAVLGPLGRGFDLQKKGQAVIVGGGIGVSPLKLLARALAERGRSMRLILGFKSRDQAASAGLFRDFDGEVFTEDGSVGSRGLVSEPLPGCLLPPPEGEPAPEVFACGPGPMLSAVARISSECGVPGVRTQVSVATHMACGVGSCQGCVVAAAGGYVKACTEGPVFDAEELKW
ncbi:MAG: dihydroorotate dehydrogenase electron transfer subunit [Thermoleophilia bacterium]|nr:dihydroorotate dehydrogenase electron transfer subunit [Thermoleophilia bacterium]